MTTKNTSSTDNPEPQHVAGKHLWRIRTENGDIFGPADLATLRTWAQDGRLAPTHQCSQDDQPWTPVSSLPELEMDWVAEITPGSFYGPIHKTAMAELVREGSIRATAPRFQRGTPHTHAPSEHEQQLETRVRELQQQLSNRVAELEAQETATRGELEQTRSTLRAQDLVFDAERQEHKAALARLQAELLTRDGRITALDTDLQRLTQLVRDRQSLEARLSDAERLVADQTRQTEQHREELELAHNLHREAERNQAILQERVSGHDRETETLRESLRSVKIRMVSVRKLLQQAGSVLGEFDATTDAEIVAPPDPIPGTAKDGPPPLATPTGSVKPGMSLTDLEAQAQRELHQLGSKGKSWFKGRTNGKAPDRG